MEVMKFKIGDKVRVREDLEKRVVEMPSGFSIVITGEMIDLTDEVVTISSVGKETYKVEELKYYEWTDEMFEPIDDPLAQKILERNNKHTGDLTVEKVNSPSHYTRGDIEVIDIIKQLTQGYEPFEAYLVGNTIKYLARANFKENKQQDLEKAEWHINKLLEEEE